MDATIKSSQTAEASMPSQTTRTVTEDKAEGSNVIRGVKVIGTESLNGRVYPISVLERCYKLYEGALVNINHKLGDEGRSYSDRIGRVVNVRCEADGVYGDLVYNPHHKDAKSLEWWAENDQKAVGLSHMAQVKSKWTPEGVEEVTDIAKVESVDLVANPATTKGLMESVDKPSKASKTSKTNSVSEADFFDEIAKRLESRMGTKTRTEGYKIGGTQIDAAWVEALEENLGTLRRVAATLKKQNTVFKDTVEPRLFSQLNDIASGITSASEKFAAVLRDVWEGSYRNKKLKGEEKTMKTMKAEAMPNHKVKFMNTYGGWRTAVKSAGAVKIDGDKDIATALDKNGRGVGEWDGEKGEVYIFSESMTKESDMGTEELSAILSDSTMDDAAKIAAIQELISLASSGDEEGGELPLGEAEDTPKDEDDKKEEPVTESVRLRKNPAMRRLIEEVETYRLRDKREQLVREARKACDVLPTYAVTESFVGVLADSEKKNWKTLIEDRRRVIFRGENPISAVATGGELTVDSLVKALRS